MARSAFRILACAVLLAAASAAEAAEGPASPGSAMSSTARYAREVTAECIRNHAYGLATNGMKLAAFCEMLGHTESLKLHRSAVPPQTHAAAR
jgi:hypothetical protein